MVASLLRVAFMYDLLLTRLSDSESSPLSSVNTLDSLSSTEVVILVCGSVRFYMKYEDHF